MFVRDTPHALAGDAWGVHFQVAEYAGAEQDVAHRPVELALGKDMPVEQAVATILQATGEDPQREGLLRTPNRVARMNAKLAAGCQVDPEALISDAIFKVDYDEMVLVRNIEFYSLWEHHMLPFNGHVHVAYIPDGRVIGLSKIPRIVDMFARRFQIQERMTSQIADFIEETLHARGVAVVVEGVHMYSVMRGVKKQDAPMLTQAMHGAFRSDQALRAEFMGHLNGRAYAD
jgi:GTP cyclohydrolase I